MIVNIYIYCITRPVDTAMNKIILHVYMRYRGAESDRGVFKVPGLQYSADTESKQGAALFRYSVPRIANSKCIPSKY